MTVQRTGQKPWWADDPKTTQAQGEGYAEGSDLRLLGCWRTIDGHLGADVSDSVKVTRITQAVKVWRNELISLGLL